MRRERSDDGEAEATPPSVRPHATSDDASWLQRHLTQPACAVAARAHTSLARSTARLLHRAHTKLASSSTLYSGFASRVRALPITEFYLYMWRVDPALLVNTMAVNYALPIAMEAMPWYLSRRKISRLLRESRNSITHRLVANESFSDSAIASFVLFSLVYALVQTVEQVLRTRVLLANRLLIKRLVLERILYSELGSLQQRYFDVFGEEVRTEQLEVHVFCDISETLNLFNTTVPSLMRGVYTLVGSAHDLWLNRDAFDALAILRPSIVGLTSEAVNYVRERCIVDAQTLQMQRNASAMSRVVTNIVDGLAEIQTNNMQRFQLVKLDAVSGEELSNQQGVTSFFNNIYRQVSNRSVFDFASEVYVVRMVMNRRKINHETYRKVQNDIDYVTRLFGRLWSQARDAHRVYETQERVIALLNLPSFIQEAKLRDDHASEFAQDDTDSATGLGVTASPSPDGALLPSLAPFSSSSPPLLPASAPTFEFESLLFRRCVFRYKAGLPLALNIHPRLPGEATPPVDVEDAGVALDDDSAAAFPRSTLPVDLIAEMQAVLSHPRLSASVLQQQASLEMASNVPTSDDSDDMESSPVHSSHVSSAVMADIMQSQESTDDEDGNVLEPSGELEEHITGDLAVRELDEFVRQARLAGTHLEFNSQESTISVPAPGAASLAPLSTADSSCFSYSPLASPSSCEAGTLLFERGKSYALIGENRSGKSTLMQLLCKLYQPSLEECDIRLNGGSDFTTLPRMLLRDRVSYVAQRPFIFPGTIEENIRIGNTHASAAEVEQAAEMAGIFTMEQPKPLAGNGTSGTRSLVDRTGMAIVAKPWEQNRLKSVLLAAGGWLRQQWMRVHGFEDGTGPSEDEEQAEEDLQREEVERVQQQLRDAPASSSSSPSAARPIHPTLLLETAERGANLSGGFAQSVALARVFLRKEAQVIILDEAMGQMDGIKKRELIFPRLFEFVRAHNMTLILISHDVPLVCKLVDTVYVMNRGECVQSGTHTQLMAQRGSAYARLVGEYQQPPAADEHEDPAEGLERMV